MRSTYVKFNFLIAILVSLCAAIVVYGSADSEFYYSTLFYSFGCVSLFWFFLHLRRLGDCRVYSGIIMVVFVSTVYSLVPIWLLSRGFEIYPFSEATIKRTFFAEFLYVCFLSALMYCISDLKTLLYSERQLLNAKFAVTTKSLTFVAAFGCIVSLMYLANYYSSGVAELAGDASRLDITHSVETGKTWLLQYVFFAWMMAISWLIIAGRLNGRLMWIPAVLIVVAVAAFVYPYALIGNRRELAGYLGFLALLAYVYKLKKIILVCGVALVGTLLLSLVRSDSSSGAGDELIFNLYGEFIFPHYPLLYYTQIRFDDWFFGGTYFRFPLYMLPDIGLWDKPKSLAHLFIDQYSIYSMGYAFTPLAEGFLNFSWVSVITVPVIISVCFRGLVKLFLRRPVYWLVGASLSLDIARGESISIFFQYLIYCAVIYSTLRLNEVAVFRRSV